MYDEGEEGRGRRTRLVGRPSALAAQRVPMAVTGRQRHAAAADGLV